MGGLLRREPTPTRKTIYCAQRTDYVRETHAKNITERALFLTNTIAQQIQSINVGRFDRRLSVWTDLQKSQNCFFLSSIPRVWIVLASGPMCFSPASHDSALSSLMFTTGAFWIHSEQLPPTLTLRNYRFAKRRVTIVGGGDAYMIATITTHAFPMSLINVRQYFLQQFLSHLS